MGLSDNGDWRSVLLWLGATSSCFCLLFLPIGIETWLRLLMLVPFLTLYSSVQHEFIHGHPFKSQTLNDLLVIVPFTLLVPYQRFKDTHLAHHADCSLCDPYDDPESWYQPNGIWQERSAISQAVFNFNNTLFGRMILGPAIAMTGFFKCDLANILKGNWRIGVKWIWHFASVGILLSAVADYGQLPIMYYLIAAYLGMSLLMVRTFLEHRAHEDESQRTVIIERGGIFGFLFLNNSFHAVHHAHPGISWYRLPAYYFKNRKQFLEQNGGYAYASYWDIFRQFSFKRKEPVPHPFEK